VSAVFRRFSSLLKKETLQLRRDPVLIAISLYVFLESLLCAAALQLEVRHVSLAYVDADRSAQSRLLLDAFRASPTFVLAGPLAGDRAVVPALKSGAAKVVLRIPANFSRSLGEGRAATMQLVLDGSDSYVAMLAMGYAQRVVLRYQQDRALLLAGSASRLDARLPQIRLVSRAWYNPAMDYPSYNMVMMVALAVPIVGILLSAAAFARERENGTLERLAISPVRPWEILLAKTIPTATLGLTGVTLGIVIAVAVLHAPLRGSLTFFYLASLVAFVASGAIGVIVATAARTIQQALLGAFFVLFPLLFLSGTITPIENMPPVLRIATFASPLRYFGEIAIGVFFRGASPAELAGSVLGLATLTAVLVSVALYRIARVA